AYLAKQATTVDVLSGGRLDLGLGIGWMPEEFAVTGGSTARRGARTEEYVAVLRTLWADEISSFDGEFYSVPAGRQDPRPVPPPALRELRADPRGQRVASRAGGHRAVLRPELGSAGGQPRGGAGCGGRTGRGNPRRASSPLSRAEPITDG